MTDTAADAADAADAAEPADLPDPGFDEVTRQLTAPGQIFEMVEQVVRGVPMRTWRHAPRSLAAVLEHTRGYGDAEFLLYESTRWTYAEHYRLAATVARRLRDHLGVASGDRVAIAMRNLPEWVAAFWGAVAAGAVVVPLNAWWKTEELRYALADAGAVVAICDTERAERLRPARAALGQLRSVVVVDDPPGAGGSVAAGSGELTWAELVGEVPSDATAPAVAIDPDDDATIFYTSGTTGQPKGVVGTHRNATTCLMNLYFFNMANRERFRGADTDAGTQRSCLLTVPLFHTTGCHAVLITITSGGGKLVLMRQFEAAAALELIERERISIFAGVPTVVMRLLDSPDIATRDVSSIRSVSFGGAPSPVGLAERIHRAFRVGQGGNGYGLTETSAVTAQNSGGDYLRKPDSVGHAVPVADLAIVPEDFAGTVPPETAPGTVGELWVRGPHVVRGYWNQPGETERVLGGGWLRTGDVASIDQEGFVYIVDRMKDVIIRGGENIYCPEVEGALFVHPAVADCAVVGIPHAELGEEVAAVVILHPGTKTSSTSLVVHLGSHLAGYKIPTRWWIRRDPLPRNAAGKVVKGELRTAMGAPRLPPG